AARLDLARELREREDRHLQLARDRLERSTDACDLLHPPLIVARALDELEVVDDEQVEAALGLKAPRLREDVGHRELARLLDKDGRFLEAVRRVRDRDELRRRETAAAHAVAVDLARHRDEALHDLHLAHLEGEHRARLAFDGRGLPDDVERETRLAEAGTSREEDEVGRL